MKYMCKVCAFSEMPYPPADYNVCPCCGVEYAVDDAFDSHEALRNKWLRAGGKWFSKIKPYVCPINWNAWDQLDLAGFQYDVPRQQNQFQETFYAPSMRGYQIIASPPVAWEEACA